MGARGLPDMYTLGPAALVPWGVHIRQTTRAHVTNTKYTTLRGQIKGKSRDTSEILL